MRRSIAIAALTLAIAVGLVAAGCGGGASNPYSGGQAAAPGASGSGSTGSVREPAPSDSGGISAMPVGSGNETVTPGGSTDYGDSPAAGGYGGDYGTAPGGTGGGTTSGSSEGKSAPGGSGGAPAPSESSSEGSASKATTVSVELYDFGIKVNGEHIDLDGKTTLKAGKTTFSIKNTGAYVHAFEIKGGDSDVKTKDLNPGDTATVTLTLSKGTYEIWCPMVEQGFVHKIYGMDGMVTVE